MIAKGRAQCLFRIFSFLQYGDTPYGEMGVTVPLSLTAGCGDERVECLHQDGLFPFAQLHLSFHLVTKQVLVECLCVPVLGRGSLRLRSSVMGGSRFMPPRPPEWQESPAPCVCFAAQGGCRSLSIDSQLIVFSSFRLQYNLLFRTLG